MQNNLYYVNKYSYANNFSNLLNLGNIIVKNDKIIYFRSKDKLLNNTQGKSYQLNIQITIYLQELNYFLLVFKTNQINV